MDPWAAKANKNSLTLSGGGFVGRVQNCDQTFLHWCFLRVCVFRLPLRILNTPLTSVYLFLKVFFCFFLLYIICKSCEFGKYTGASLTPRNFYVTRRFSRSDTRSTQLFLTKDSIWGGNIYKYMCIWNDKNALGLFKRFNVENKINLRGGWRCWCEYNCVVMTSAWILHIKTY